MNQADPCFDRFFDRLVALRPASILDIGCGAGRLLARCRDADINARGIDPDQSRIDEASAAGLAAALGDAESLPFAAREFDWAILHMVLHHLRDPAAALAEAARVCRSGILIAEPWYDRSIPSQQRGARLDEWSKRLDRRMERVHRAGLSAEEIAASLAAVAPDGFTADFEPFAPLEPWTIKQTRDFHAADLASLPPGDSFHTELAALERESAGQPITDSGCLIATLRRTG